MHAAAGMILERLDGKGPNRHIMKSEFNDVHYMEEFLFCLFNALDIGQKAIGFHHSGELRPSDTHFSPLPTALLTDQLYLLKLTYCIDSMHAA